MEQDGSCYQMAHSSEDSWSHRWKMDIVYTGNTDTHFKKNFDKKLKILNLNETPSCTLDRLMKNKMTNVHVCRIKFCPEQCTS